MEMSTGVSLLRTAQSLLTGRSIQTDYKAVAEKYQANLSKHVLAYIVRRIVEEYLILDLILLFS